MSIRRGLRGAVLGAVIGASVLAGAPACGGAQQRKETLADAIRGYNEGVRWQRFEVAATHVPPAERADFIDAMDERGDDLKISDYELVKLEPRGAKEARVQVKVSWYLESEGTLRETHAVQTWERHGPAWLMVEEVRLRGAEMPGLVNRATDKAGGEADATDAAPGAGAGTPGARPGDAGAPAAASGAPARPPAPR